MCSEIEVSHYAKEFQDGNKSNRGTETQNQ